MKTENTQLKPVGPRGSYIRRGSTAALLFSCVIVALCSAINLPEEPPKVLPPRVNAAFGANEYQSQILTFADRVAYQHAIEEVYWRHRIWPKERPDPKPSLDAVMSQAQLEKKVADYLCNSQALEDYWQRPLTAEQLQAEMERIASHTKQPEVLREIFATLGNDPVVIAECLARPVLAERLVTELYAHDQRFHGELKRRAQAELRTHRRVREMNQTSGIYTEMEWIKSDAAETGSAPAAAKNVQAVKMNGSEWQERVGKLAKEFGDPKAGDAWGQIKTDILSPLEEDEGHYYALAIMKKGKDRLKLATVAWLKEPLRSWVARAETQVPVTMAAVSASYLLPSISSTSTGGCIAWTPTSITNAPEARRSHTAVWTGSEMIVWGGSPGSGFVNLNTGGRYNPSTDSWTATSTASAPTGRNFHTAVWTGSEMIVWGGNPGLFNYLNTGGRYNPSTDSWTATSTLAPCPPARGVHTAVWTGSEMIVWSGLGVGSLIVNSGGRYNPSTDSWTATSTTNAPGRSGHTAVWSGGEMVVWGGTVDDHGTFPSTGGRYNLSTDSWIATSTTNAPAGRWAHTAVWTGSEMIVWGGAVGNLPVLDTGGRYNPNTDSWTATSTTGAPTARDLHSAVWTGSEMIVWGGSGAGASPVFNTGGRYKPSTDSWTTTTVVRPGRTQHTAVWTGSEMIVWGGTNSGVFNTGFRYCAQTPTVQSAVSRKTHGSAGSFDLNLPVSGMPGIECRSGGETNDYTIVVTFVADVSVGGNPQATVTSGIGAIGSSGVSNGGVVTVAGNVVTIPLTNVGDAQTTNVRLNDVNGSSNVDIPISLLIGDTNGDGFVNAGDALQTRNRSGQTATATNFRSDVNIGGSINSGDTTIVRGRSGNFVP